MPDLRRHFALCLLPLFLAPLLSCSKPPPPKRESIEIKTVRLGLYDDIPEMDFVPEGDSVLHIAFIAGMRDSAKAGHELLHAWYQRYDLIRGASAAPIHLASVPRGKIRIAATGAILHIVLPGTLRDFMSNDDGMTWRQNRPLLPDDDVRQFDTAALGDSLLVVCLRSIPGDSFSVVTLTATPASIAVSRVAALRGNPFSAPNPRIIADAQGTDLFFGISESQTDTTITEGRRSTTFRYRPHIFHASGLTAGPWSVNELRPLVRASHGLLQEQSGSLEELDALKRPFGWLVLYVSYELYATQVDSSGSITPCVRIATPAGKVPNPGFTMRGVSVSQGPSAVLAWTDTRYEPTGLLTNLFGRGPRWASNNALSLQLTSGPEIIPPQEPQRLTGSSSYVRRLRARSGDRRAFVVWSGWQRVGDKSAQYDARPSIFLAR